MVYRDDPTKGWPRGTTEVVRTPMVVASSDTSDYALSLNYAPGGSLFVEGWANFQSGMQVNNTITNYGQTLINGYYDATVGDVFVASTARPANGVSIFSVQALGNTLIKASTNAVEVLRLQTLGASTESLVIQDLRDDSIVLSIDADGNFSGTSAATTWKSFTPVLSGSTWDIGNGVLVGTYSKIGKTVHFSIELIFGSTSVYGTGTPQISVTPAGVTSGAVAGTSFNATYTDDSTGDRYAGRGVLHLGSLGTPHMYTLASPMTTLTDTVPFTWATGDSIAMTGTYQTA
jgi:hypothetical protein